MIRKMILRVLWYKYDVWDTFRDYRGRDREKEWPKIIHIIKINSKHLYYVHEDHTSKEYFISQEELNQNILIEKV